MQQSPNFTAAVCDVMKETDSLTTHVAGDKPSTGNEKSPDLHRDLRKRLQEQKQVLKLPEHIA